MRRLADRFIEALSKFKRTTYGDDFAVGFIDVKQAGIGLRSDRGIILATCDSNSGSGRFWSVEVTDAEGREERGGRA